LKAVTRRVGLAVCLLTVASGESVALDASVASSAVVPAVYRTIANEHDVPADVLYAVALTESGTHVEALETRLPWPLTLNIAGEGSYYPTRHQAVRAAREAFDGGIRSIDLGLMQVNWRYHADALGSLEAAIDPLHNLTVGARILATCHARRGDWFAALECYHAPDHPSRAKAYRQRVERAWRQLSAAG